MKKQPPPVLFNPRRTALLVIDVQNDLCHPEGVAARQGCDMTMMPDMVKKLRELTEEARRYGVLLIHLQHTVLERGRSDASAWIYFLSSLVGDGKILIEGTWGHKFLSEVKPAEKELVVQKHRSSAFYNTRLEILLHAHQIQTVALSGVLAEGCVESTLRDAFHRDFYPLLVSDATASYSKEVHNAYISIVSARHDIITVDRLVSAWKENLVKKKA
jgi:ureidoacrylate peracid hydrolase